MPTAQKTSDKKVMQTMRVAPVSRPQKKESRYTEYNLHKAAEIALCYGFTPIKTPEVTKIDISNAKTIPASEANMGEPGALTPRVEEKIALLRAYIDKKLHAGPQPVMVYYEGRCKDERFKRDNKETLIELEILGTSMSVAEAILIQTAYTILEEEGFTNISVDINSLGDRDSFSRFTKELISYYRKHLESMPAICRQMLKKDVFELFTSSEQRCVELKEEAPKPINFLSEISRSHFKEILEFVETTNIPYRINNSLLIGKHYCSHTIFEIKGFRKDDLTQELNLAAGIRYNALSKKMGMKKELGAVGVTISLRDAKVKSAKKISCWKFKKPLLYFVQMGPEAKQKSLRIIEILRKSRISLYHSLMKDKLVAQLSTAENLKVPYIIIMGQKESLDSTVIVRNMQNRSQDTVKIDHLTEHLKTLL